MSDTTTPARPQIDFSGSSRATAREYAEAANSRVLNTQSQVLLRLAAGGKSVDAYDLNEAVLDAMRSASTRLGQSMARRDLTRKIAYLGHIVQAVLNNHADCLPAYGEGERSRVAHEARAEVEEVRRALDHQAEVNQSLTRDLTASREAFEEVKGAANDEVTRLLDVAKKRDALLAETVADRDALAATLAYVLEIVDGDEAAKSRILGFYDGASTVLGS